MPESTKEKLVLVESFDELRAGLLIVLRGCYCGSDHRAMLLGRRMGTIDLGHEPVPLYPMVPTLHQDRAWLGLAVDRKVVARRKLWRVVSDSPEAERQHEREIRFLEGGVYAAHAMMGREPIR